MAASHRRFLLLLFAYAGSASCLFFITLPSSSPIWQLSALLAVISNVSFGISIVSLNSYLPQLARNDPSVEELERRHQTEDYRPLAEARDEPVNSSCDSVEDSIDAGRTHEELEPLTSDTNRRPDFVLTRSKEYNAALSLATSKISSRGIATGYAAGIVLLLVLLIPVNKLNGSTLSLRLAIAITGLWWGIFTFPAMLWLPRGGNQLFDIDTNGRAGVRQEGVWWQIREAWLQLARTFRPREIAKLRNTFWFLLVWFLLSDGILSHRNI